MSGHNRQACVAAGELDKAQYVEAVCTQGADLARQQLLYACSAVCFNPCHPHEQAECTVESDSDSDDSDRDSDSDIDGGGCGGCGGGGGGCGGGGGGGGGDNR